MSNKYLTIFYTFLLSSCILLGATESKAISVGRLSQDSTRIANLSASKSRVSNLGNKSTENLHFAFKPFAPAANPFKNRNGENEKVLSNVKVFPNQISDQINLSFRLNQDSNVSIKVMDALGNEVSTLLSQRLPSGEQNNTFNISNKLNQGYYFIRVIAGTETIVKRIEVL